MRVKRLEIQGFKSFKDKTVIHFDEGITGIVGPNGCGKSNIVDAFFWVMGEQSYKHMRGTSGDDLIFNGSSKYSPLAVAEATMVLETDYEGTADAHAGASVQDIPLHLRAKEIAVTRRLYRDGGGEYFINGVQARLKDIQELFMDTGVGAKGYSVVEQGQIGKIVNSKPEERRLLVEEAAGIAKYKARKKESLRKMEATQANLARLNDVIAEIERNMGSLERQAQKARQYHKLKDELLDKEMTWARRKSKLLRERLEALKTERDASEQELHGLRAELQVAENGVEIDRVSQTTDSKTAEDLQARISELSDSLARERSALELSKRRQTDLATQKAVLEEEKSQLTTSIAEESAKLSGAETEEREADGKFAEASQRVQNADEEVRAQRTLTEQARQALDSAQKELVSSVSQSSDLTNRAAALASRIEAARAQAQKLAESLLAQRESAAQSASEVEKTGQNAELARAKREELQNRRKDGAASLNNQEQAVREAEENRNRVSKEATQIRSKLQSLEELATAYEGFGQGPKSAMEWARDNAAGSIHALADAFDVDSEYEAALSGWLEGSIETLVSASPAYALGAIERIRDDKQGRASIHVSTGGGVGTYNRIRFDYIRELLEKAGFRVLGELSSHVRIGEGLCAQVREIASETIDNVCVVESSAPLAAFIASPDCLKLGHWSIVSLDGVALDCNGILRGGSNENDGTSTVLRRKRAIHELEAQAESADARLAEAEEAVTAAKRAADEGRTALQSLDSELKAAEIEAASLERDLHQMRRSASEASNRVAAAEREHASIEENAAAAEADRASIEARVAEVQARRAELEASITGCADEFAQQETILRAKEASLQGLRINEAQLRERAGSLKRELDAGRALINDRERRLAEVNRILSKTDLEASQFTGGEDELEKRIEALVQQLSTKREELAVIKDRLEQSNAHLNGVLERIRELRKTADDKTARATHLALETEKLNGDMAHLVQNLEEKYGPGCLDREPTTPVQEEMTDPVVTAEMSAEEEKLLGEEVERLRERIRRLGEVNPSADSEYDEVKKRYDYLATEKADLDHSIQNLQDAIEHINKTSEERFRKAFDAIKERFERLFPIIFGGGSAHLSLVYPEGSTDILEAGVDILAQPPGKKVSNITLLSGGEKALTAVSLIFAIFMVKPSPFCVLDEVDAPLDDANIGKFNALLREMSAKSQFILITHNKKTMELNDVLYGVTMEEPGVSKMVSIQMS